MKELITDIIDHGLDQQVAVAGLARILKCEIAELQSDVGVLSAQQLKMDLIGADKRKIFATTKEDPAHGIAEVWKAMEILREYHVPTFVQQRDAAEVHKSSSGAGTPNLENRGDCECFFVKRSYRTLSLSLRDSEAESSCRR